MDFYDCYVVIANNFLQFLHSLITYLTVRGACRAFISTEEAEADAFKSHSGHVFLQSATPARCIK